MSEGVLLAPRAGFMHLSSEYGTNNGDTSYVTFPVQDAIATYSETYAMQIGVHNMTLPHVWYNMKGYNFSVTILRSNTFVATLPTQNYTAPLLASTLSTLLSAYATATFGYAANFWVMTYNSTTNRFVLTSSTAVPFQINFVANNCYYELGGKQVHLNQATLTSESAGTLTFPNAADLTGTNGVYINILNYTTNQRPSYTNLQQSSILCRIPIDTPFGAVQVYSPENIQFAVIPNAAFSSLTITLTDDAGNLLDLQGCDWTLTLHFKYAEILKPLTDSSNMRVTPLAYSWAQPYGR